MSKEKCVWIPCEQGSPEWREARLGRVTASRFCDVMAVDRSGAPLKVAHTYMMDLVVEDLTRKPTDEIKAKQLEWGKKNERAARAAYTWATGNGVDEVGVAVHKDLSRVAASSDGLIGDDGGVEIKCPFSSQVHLKTLLSRQVPREYVWQVQGGMWVLGRNWTHFVSYDPRMPESHQLAVVLVQRDDDLIERLSTRMNRFLEDLEELLARVNKSAKLMEEMLDGNLAALGSGGADQHGLHEAGE